MRLGLSYQMNDKVQLCLEAEKNIDAKASIKMGMDYQALDPLFVRCGIQTNPIILTFGLACNGRFANSLIFNYTACSSRLFS